MQLKVFTLRFEPELGQFDDAHVQAWLVDKEVVDLRHAFFEFAGLPTWSLVVTWVPRVNSAAGLGPPRGRGEGPVAASPIVQPTATTLAGAGSSDLREALLDDQRRLFDALRVWRNARARRDGKPAYVMLTNRMMAEVARVQPRTRAELGRVEGVGEARLRDYGDEILAVVAHALAPDGA